MDRLNAYFHYLLNLHFKVINLPSLVKRGTYALITHAQPHKFNYNLAGIHVA